MFNIMKDQNGQDSVEYVALAALGVVIAVSAYLILKPKVQEKAEKMGSW